jgi:hypothetical protein
MGAFIFAGGDPSKVDVSGYTKGDVLAADTTGTLQPVTVGPDGDVLTADSISADGVDWQPGGGGGGASPGNTVVTEQAFGQASTAGALLTYSRADHTHGTPVAPTVPAAGNSVVTEQAFGQASTAGVGATFSRVDHTHGTPASPSVPSASGSVVTEQAFGQASAVGVAGTFSRGDHTHGTPAAPSAGTKVTLGTFNTSGNVTCAGGLPYTQVDSDLVIAAVVNDILGVSIQAVIMDTGAELVMDMATRVSGADVNYLSSGTGTPRFNGAVPPWLQTTIGSGNFPTLGDEVLYKVQAGDISAGTVTLRPYGAGDGGSRVVIRSAAFPLRCWVKNYGQGI